MPNLSLTELLVIFLIIVLLFGAKRIPDLAESIGKATRKFKDTQREAKSTLSEETPTPTPEKPKDDSPKS